ncbi:MAG: tripartite tricarboxylate transporter substrate-binding protein [Beijerinckiaceae bacterium]|nr:tripartite tricarboxylate transporter substrate-binding protein [Beijerinckiaceae bacterium]
MTEHVFKGIFAAALLAAPGAAYAQADKAFFNGKSVTYIVATAPGGGYDTYGRLVAEYMQKYLPGSTFVVRNMPGAGHLVGTNALYASKPDGLTLGTFNTGLIYTQLAKHSGVKFDLTKMSWIGKAATDPRAVIIAAQSPIKSWPDLTKMKDPQNFATSGPGGANFVETLALTAILKLPIKMLPGYNGTDDQLAMRRGEIVGSIGSRSSFEQFVANGYGRFVGQFGGTRKDLPQMSQYVKGNAEAERLVRLITAQGDIARLTAGPPGVPAPQLAGLRDAYRQAMEDKDMQARADKLGLPVEPLFGEDVAKAVSEALNQSPEVVNLLVEGFSKGK